MQVRLSPVFATPWTAAHQASWSFTISRSLLKLMSIESVMPSNHLILCCPLILLPSVFLSISQSFPMHFSSLIWVTIFSSSDSISPSSKLFYISIIAYFYYFMPSMYFYYYLIHTKFNIYEIWYIHMCVYIYIYILVYSKQHIYIIWYIPNNISIFWYIVYIGIYPKSYVYYLVHMCELSRFSCVWLFTAPWTVACQPPLSVGFSRQEYWTGLPCLPPRGSLPPRDRILVSCMAGRLFTTEPSGIPYYLVYMYYWYTPIFIYYYLVYAKFDI